MAGVPKLEKEKVINRCNELNLKYILHERKEFNGKLKWVVTYECETHGQKETSWDSMRIIKGCRACSLSKGLDKTKKDEYLQQARQIAENNGGELLSTEYITAKEKLKFKCEEGHILYINANNLKNGNWCKKCKHRRYSIEEIKQHAILKGGECLSPRYYSNKDILTWKCINGHVWEDNYYNVKNFDIWCQECKKENNKFSWNYIDQFIKNNGGTLLEDKAEELDMDAVLEVKCKNDHSFKRSIKDLIYKERWCIECNRQERKLYEFNELQKVAEDRGYQLLSSPEEYEDQETKLKWLCPNEHVWICNGNNFKRERSCKECLLESRRIDIQLIHDLAENKNGAVDLVDGYQHSKQLLNWVCSEGHSFQINVDSALRGTWCPTCTSRYINEAKCKYIIEHLTGKTFNKTRTVLGRYKDFNTFLELDMYNDELKLALEHNGKQHYSFVKYFHETEEEFIKLKERDILKRDECIKKGIKLIVVKYDIEKDEDKINYIKTQLRELNIPIVNENIDMKGYY